MLAWKMVEHSALQVWENRAVAYQLTLVPYAVIVVLGILMPAPAIDVTAGVPDIASGNLFGAFISGLVSAVMSLWIAVLWHRFILLDERPTGWIPRWLGGQMWSYFVTGFLIVVVVALVTIVVGIVLGLLLVPLGLGAITGVIGFGLGIWLFYRLCPALPAAASEKPLKFTEAFEATKGHTATIFALVGLVFVGVLLMGLPGMLFGDPSGTLSVVYQSVVGWFVTLFGSSVLTTFYQHFVGGRRFD